MTIVEEKPVSTLFRRAHQKVNLQSTAFSLPVCHGFNHKNLYQEPEEEVFSISLESPGRKLSQSYDWVDQDYPASTLYTSSNSEYNVMASVATSALELESSQASVCQLLFTPAKKKSRRALQPRSTAKPSCRNPSAALQSALDAFAALEFLLFL